jgi:hypothetical protein
MPDPTAEEWIRDLAARLSVEPPNAAEQNEILDLAGVAAHASERTAAPLSCWLVARAGLTPESGLALVRQLAEENGDQA